MPACHTTHKQTRLLSNQHKMSLQTHLSAPLAEDSATPASYIFGQPSYPSLFRASEERPQLASFPWWEDQATTTLYSFDIEAFKRVVYYGIFTDEQLPRFVLTERSEAFTIDLIKPRARALRLEKYQRVEEALRQCKPTFAPVISWAWFPTYTDSDKNPLAIAKAIDNESHLHFARIPFEELVRYALDYPNSRVEWFLQQHTTLYAHILDHLSAFPDEVQRYAEVEKVGCLVQFWHFWLIADQNLESIFEVEVLLLTVLWPALWKV